MRQIFLGHGSECWGIDNITDEIVNEYFELYRKSGYDSDNFMSNQVLQTFSQD